MIYLIIYVKLNLHLVVIRWWWSSWTVVFSPSRIERSSPPRAATLPCRVGRPGHCACSSTSPRNPWMRNGASQGPRLLHWIHLGKNVIIKSGKFKDIEMLYILESYLFIILKHLNRNFHKSKVVLKNEISVVFSLPFFLYLFFPGVNCIFVLKTLSV